MTTERDNILKQAEIHQKSGSLLDNDSFGLTTFKEFFKDNNLRQTISYKDYICIGGLPFHVDYESLSKKTSNTASSIVTNSNSVGSDSFIKRPSEFEYTFFIQDEPIIGFLTRIFMFNLAYGNTRYSTILNDAMAYIILAFENAKLENANKDTLAKKEGYQDVTKKDTSIDSPKDTETKNAGNTQNKANSSNKINSFIQFLCIRLYLGFSVEQFKEGDPKTTIDRIKKSYSTDFLNNEKLAEGISQLIDNYSSFFSGLIFQNILKTFDSKKYLKNTFNTFKDLFKEPLPKTLYEFLIELILVAQKSSGRQLAIHTPGKGWSNAVITSTNYKESYTHSNLIRADISYSTYDSIKTRFYLKPIDNKTTLAPVIIVKQTSTKKNKKNNPPKKKGILFHPYDTYVGTTLINSPAPGVSSTPVTSGFRAIDQDVFFEREVFKLALSKKAVKFVNIKFNETLWLKLKAGGHTGGQEIPDNIGNRNWKPFFVLEKEVNGIFKTLLNQYTVYKRRELLKGTLEEPISKIQLDAYKVQVTYPKNIK